jgi:uncharacterized DUF497 family protein
MEYIHFTWNDKKNRINNVKHKINSEEAKTAFFDPHAILIHDPDHSALEDRFLLLGMSSKNRLLVVSHCYRSNEEEIRIISARKADKDETVAYGGY